MSERLHNISPYYWTLELRIFIVEAIFGVFILTSNISTLINDYCPNRHTERMKNHKPRVHSIGRHMFKSIIKMRKGIHHTKTRPQTTLHGYEVSTMLIIYLLTYIAALITLSLFFFVDQFLIYKINYCETDDPYLDCFGYYYDNDTDRFQYRSVDCTNETAKEIYNFTSYHCQKYVYNFTVGVDGALTTLEFGGLIFIITSWLILVMARIGHGTLQRLACRMIVLAFQILVFILLNCAALAYIWFFPDPDSTLINFILLIGMAVNIPWNGFRKIDKTLTCTEEESSNDGCTA